jgi:hypothetical protein
MDKRNDALLRAIDRRLHTFLQESAEPPSWIEQGLLIE